MVVELIAKDKEEKLQFTGKCKLTINSLSKLLLVEPFNEEFKMISAMFNWKFVAQKNILFIFAENDFQDFALIFDNTRKCKKVYDFLLIKGATLGDDKLICERFLPSLFNEISVNNESSLKMKRIIIKFIGCHDEKEKQEYIQILKVNNIYDLFYPSDTGREQKYPRKRKARDITHPDEDVTQSNTHEENLRINFKRKYTNKIVEAADFEILKYIQNGVSRQKLFIFSTSDRKYCYEYVWKEYCQYFVCHACCKKGRYLSAKIIKRNGEDAIKLNKLQHVCEMQEYKEIIENPNYEVLSYECKRGVTKRLILFLDSSHEKCYEYYKKNDCESYICCGCEVKKHYTGACICYKEDGTEFVLLKSNQHVCKPRIFNPEKYSEKQIIGAENFKIFKNIQDGIDKSKMVIFTSPDKSTCYEYYWKHSEKQFICYGCQKRRQWSRAEICSNSDWNISLKLSKRQHMCEPREYNPEKFEISDEISESKIFKILEFMHNGELTSRLIVFCETNKNLCYEYYWNKVGKKYYCTYCPMKTQVTTTVCHKEDSKEYLIHSKTQHVCDLIEFDPEKYRDDAVIPKSLYRIIPTTIRQAKSKILVVFTSEEKMLCYRFLYNGRRKLYYCSKCFNPFNLLITATIQNEGNENEFLYVSNQQHVCEPLEYSTLSNGNIIQAPNYQLVKRKANGKIVQRMAVFTNEEKSECFEYTWNEREKYFLCSSCNNGHNTQVFARFKKNDENEECVELSLASHKCKPITFLPENITPRIVKLPDFKLFEATYRQKIIKKLAIFDSENKKLGRIYTYHEIKKNYHCYRCNTQKKVVTAKVLQDENGHSYLELNKNEHVCEPQKI